MFNNEFFPTPSSIIKLMLDGVNLTDKTILEPSAGKGDIIDYIKDQYSRHNTKIYCIEREPDLIHILRENGHRVIADDFLTYNGCYLFDFIILNPPFSNGDEHLLKAWDILENGEIICLLNSETVRNPHTKNRALLASIIEANGTVNHIGQVFKDAERTTQVEVCIVRLQKKTENQKFSFDFEPVTNSEKMKLEESTFENQIAVNDIIGNMIIQYEALQMQFVDYMKVIDGMKFYAQGIFTESSYRNVREIVEKCYSPNKNDAYNSFNDIVKENMWNIVLSKMDFDKYLTNSVRKKFYDYCKHQGHMDFTKENVFKVITILFENKIEIQETAIIDVFDIFTKFYKENRVHIEGWKTNDSWKVNRKIILPNWVKYGSYYSTDDLKRFGDRFSTNWDRKHQYSDIDKVMCYITGTSYENCYFINDALEHTFDRLGYVKTGDSFDNLIESSFFYIRFFKKGTVHLEFKDVKLWQEFNLRACKGKQWLPPEQ